MTTADVRGKTVLVTGASSGIGRATALAFAAVGARVAAADVDERGGRATVAQITQGGGRSLFVRTDVSRAEDVQRLIEETLRAYGRLDAAVNNAGIEGVLQPTAEYPEDQWDRLIAVNLKGVWLGMKYELPVMVRQGRGAIVNVASVAGLVGIRGLSAYVASKHGIVGLTKTAALEYATVGVRVNAVCPGVIETPMVDRVTKGDPQATAPFVAQEPVGRMGQPEEVAQAVLWLCSEQASFVTGHALTVDGGWTAQ